MAAPKYKDYKPENVEEISEQKRKVSELQEKIRKKLKTDEEIEKASKVILSWVGQKLNKP